MSSWMMVVIACVLLVTSFLIVGATTFFFKPALPTGNLVYQSDTPAPTPIKNSLVVANTILPTATTIPAAITTPVPIPALPGSDFVTLWYSDFEDKLIGAFNRDGKKVWQQQMDSPPIPPSGYNTHTEYVTVAPNGNLIVADGEGMMVQEIDRTTHQLIWQYGVKDKQSSEPGYLHQPDKSYKINDHEVLINDGNNRRVIIVDQHTNKIVWQYGHTLSMGTKPGWLSGNTFTAPYRDDQHILITDTLQKTVFLINRATSQIEWQWTKPDAKWIQHVSPTNSDSFVMEDRQKNEVFEVNKAGTILWTIHQLSDGSILSEPMDSVKLGNGNVLIAEAGRGRIIEVNPLTRQIVRTYSGAGFVTTIAIDNQGV